MWCEKGCCHVGIIILSKAVDCFIEYSSPAKVHVNHTLCVYRFIQKQGLDRTFVECDNHMWRVDTRPLPPEVTVDGGSDWIVLHRNYSRYLVTDKSKFLTDIKKYYEFSLLPAEVSQN